MLVNFVNWLLVVNCIFCCKRNDLTAQACPQIVPLCPLPACLKTDLGNLDATKWTLCLSMRSISHPCNARKETSVDPNPHEFSLSTFTVTLESRWCHLGVCLLGPCFLAFVRFCSCPSWYMSYHPTYSCELEWWWVWSTTDASSSVFKWCLLA